MRATSMGSARSRAAMRERAASSGTRKSTVTEYGLSLAPTTDASTCGPAMLIFAICPDTA